MRIIMLPKFIQDEESETFCLKNCNLVVDGNIFFYNLYENSNIPYVFGCNAEDFAKYIRLKTLNQFKKANVKCYFVFKGGDSDINKKMAIIDFASHYTFVPPIFTKEVYRQVLDEMGIDYTTSVAENINDCVALAEALHCPILSDDVKYCFKKVPYIQSRTLKYTNRNNYITCKQFKLQSFLDKYSLTERQIAIFVTLSDVHVFKQNYFDDLLKKWKVLDENLYKQNKNLLKWLSKHTENEALNAISMFITDESDNSKFLNQIQTFLVKMHNNEWSIATEYLINKCKIHVKTPDPQWFEKGIVTQNIAIPYINLYKYKFIQGSTVREKKGSSDTVMVAMDIIIYAYNLLTNFQGGIITVYQDAENSILVDTKDFKVKHPGYRCKDSVFENGWEVVRQLNLFVHFLKENELNINSISQIPLQGRVLTIAMAYFSRKKMAVGKDVTKAVYCFFIYQAILHKLSMHKKDPSSHNQDECETLEQVKEKYAKLEDNEEIKIFEEDKLNTLEELQYCLLHMNYLNILCGRPYFSSKYHKSVNGTFVYKLMRDMEDCDVDLFIEELFLSAPNTLKAIRWLIIQYNRLLDNNKPEKY